MTGKLSKLVHAGLHRFLFTEYFLKIKKGLKLRSRTHFSYFFYENFCFVMLHKLAKFHYQTVFTSQVLNKMRFMFMFRHLMTSWHLNIWKLKIWLSQERKELSKWNKKHFSLFHKCSLLDVQNKLAKM